MLRAEPEKQPPPPGSLLVDVIKVTASSPAITIKSNGTVRPIESLNLIPEVRGRVVKMAPSFNEGGHVLIVADVVAFAARVFGRANR